MHTQGTAVPSEQGTARFGSGRADRIAYTVAEVAALLGKHINTIYGWVRSGALPSERISAAAVFAMDDDMRRYLDQEIAPRTRVARAADAPGVTDGKVDTQSRMYVPQSRSAPLTSSSPATYSTDSWASRSRRRLRGTS